MQEKTNGEIGSYCLVICPLENDSLQFNPNSCKKVGMFTHHIYNITIQNLQYSKAIVFYIEEGQSLGFFRGN